jgi:hypothetical protein
MGNLSRLINRVCGGKPGETLCARWARTRGSDCWPCLAVGFVLRNPMHCVDELIYQLKKERKL